VSRDLAETYFVTVTICLTRAHRPALSQLVEELDASVHRLRPVAPWSTDHHAAAPDGASHRDHAALRSDLRVLSLWAGACRARAPAPRARLRPLHRHRKWYVGAGDWRSGTPGKPPREQAHGGSDDGVAHTTPCDRSGGGGRGAHAAGTGIHACNITGEPVPASIPFVRIWYRGSIRCRNSAICFACEAS